jgi:hypothetical protein
VDVIGDPAEQAYPRGDALEKRRANGRLGAVVRTGSREPVTRSNLSGRERTISLQ